jgi:predicted amidophosphoribosyltransferase
VFDALLQAAQALLIQPSCPICRASLEGSPAAKTGAELQPCGLCIEGYGLGQSNTSGNEPLPWKALGTYQGEFRQLVLQIKQQPQSRTGRAVIQLLANHHPLPQGALLVPIPSWKKKRSYPLPKLIAAGFGQPSTMLLQRTRAGLSQHHLNRSMGMHNLHGAFHAAPAPMNPFSQNVSFGLLTTFSRLEQQP